MRKISAARQMARYDTKLSGTYRARIQPLLRHAPHRHDFAVNLVIKGVVITSSEDLAKFDLVKQIHGTILHLWEGER